MTHAIYTFWAKTNDLDKVMSKFKKWIDERGDANNWYQPLIAVNKRGEERKLVEEGDYRGRDKTADSLLEDYDTIDDYKKFAWICVIRDSGAFKELPPISIGERSEEEKKMLEKMDKMNLEEFPMFFFKNALETIRKRYEEVDLSDPDHIEAYKRKKLTRYFENLLNNIAFDRELPFLRNGTPYDYRAFKLPIKDEGGESILLVDIHT